MRGFGLEKPVSQFCSFSVVQPQATTKCLALRSEVKSETRSRVQTYVDAYVEYKKEAFARFGSLKCEGPQRELSSYSFNFLLLVQPFVQPANQ